MNNALVTAARLPAMAKLCILNYARSITETELHRWAEPVRRLITSSSKEKPLEGARCSEGSYLYLIANLSLLEAFRTKLKVYAFGGLQIKQWS